MPRNIVASLRLASGPGKAPSRFRIWKAGNNRGDYGDLFVTPEAVARVMAAFARRGNALVMDYEHALNLNVNPALNPEDPPPTAGYLDLERVDTESGPEVWGVPRWSDCGRDAPVPDEVCCARHQIESGQRCYVSPDFDIDPRTREPMCINRVSLVAEPATWAINMLASASATRGRGMDEKQIRAAYALAKLQSEAADGELKAAAAAYVEQLKAAAAAMGVDVEVEPAPASERAEGQAAASDEPADKPAPTPQVAKVTAAKVTPMQSAKHITMDDVRAELARQDETKRLRGVVASRMPKGSENVVASMSLTQLRQAARDLPAPVEDKGTGGDSGGNITAGNRDGAMTPEEKFEVKRIHGALGITQSTNLTAARKVWADDPIEGAVEVDIFKAMSREGREAARKVEG